jgi:hypothetical protein
MSAQLLETETLSSIRTEFARKGYRPVTLTELGSPPAVFARYRPDLLLARGNDILVIEVKDKRNKSVEKQLEMIQAEIEKTPNWKFLIRYLSDDSPQKVSSDDLKLVIDSVIEATKDGHNSAAFLLAWGAFEAAARRKLPKIFSRPQSPGRIVTVLAERGLIDPNLADELRALANKRNALVHGKVDETIIPREIETIISIIKELAE